MISVGVLLLMLTILTAFTLRSMVSLMPVIMMHTPVIPGSVSADLTVPQDGRCAFLQVHAFDDSVLTVFLLEEQCGAPAVEDYDLTGSPSYSYCASTVWAKLPSKDILSH